MIYIVRRMEARELAEISSGTTFDGRYRILGRLGRGGMGHVFAAVHVTLDQPVAIKVLHPRLANDERFRARFLQEARAASMIRHPNVVEIKDFGHALDGSVYFVMEYLRGHDLSVELRQQGALPWARARNILLQAAGALQAAHAKQIIHRDVKPGNCFLLADEEAGLVDVVKLVDFGIAKVGDPALRKLTGTGEILGTAAYMAPEQARAEPLDARSDVYSLGAMAYEMLTGLRPFRGRDVLSVIAAHLEVQPEPLRSLVPEIPAAVDAMVLKMLAKAPDDRYPSMKAVMQALRAIPETTGTRSRSTKLWIPAGGRRPPASQGMTSEPTPPPARSVAGGSLAPGAGTLVDDQRTTVLPPMRSRAPRTVGAWPSLALASVDSMAGTSSSAGSTSSTEPQGAMSDTMKPMPRSRGPLRPSRRFVRLALLGLLGLLAGSGTVLVAKAWLADDGGWQATRGHGRATR